MKICPNCGTSSPDTNTYCNRCGYVFNKSRPRPTPPPQPQPQPQYVPATPVSNSQRGKGFAIAGMVCGISSFLAVFLAFYPSILILYWPYIGIALAVTGIVLSAIAKSKGFRGGMATAGIVCGSVLLGIYSTIIILVFAGAFSFLNWLL